MALQTNYRRIGPPYPPGGGKGRDELLSECEKREEEKKEERDFQRKETNC